MHVPIFDTHSILFLKLFLVATVAVPHPELAHSHFWGHCYSCFGFQAHLVFHRLQPSTVQTVTHLCTDPDHGCLTSVIRRKLVYIFSSQLNAYYNLPHSEHTNDLLSKDSASFLLSSTVSSMRLSSTCSANELNFFIRIIHIEKHI